MHASLENFTFGVEFEVLLPLALTRAHAASRIAQLTGIPLLGHPTSSSIPGSWKTITDGSVRGHGAHGLEFVSPVLRGQTGLDEVAKFANALREIGATVNSTCGFHVHVGAADCGLDFFKTLIKLYGRFEDAIDSLMPALRRGNEATYCRSVKLVSSAAIEAAPSIDSLARSIAQASRAAGDRYHKVNVASFYKHRTVEFRQFAGTVDAGKAVNWIITCLRLVAAAKAGKTGDTATVAAIAIAWDLSRLAGKAAHCATLIARTEGATNDEIRRAFGYRTISARTQLKKSGLAFTETRDRATGKTRFHAVTATAPAAVASPAPVAPTLQGLADVIEAGPEERAFFSRRGTRS